MIINLTSSIDVRREVKLVGQIPSAFDAEIWNNLLTSTVELFDRFIGLGGTESTIANQREPYCQGKFDCSNGNFIYSWPRFPYGINALSIMLRMLSSIRQKDEFIESVTIEGTEIESSDSASLKDIKENMSILPSRMQNLPFKVQILSFGAWFNIECDLAPPIPPEIPYALNEIIWCWRNVAVAGGFGSLETHSGETPNDVPDMGIDGPIIADDFLEWHCLMTGIPHESLNSLINMLAVFSKKVLSVTSVYIG